jgi:uncharacterized protein YciI
MRLFALGLLLAMGSSVHADYFSPEAAAKAAANMLNEAKTVQGVVDYVSLGVSAEEAKGLAALLKKDMFKGQSTGQKIPKAKAVGPKVTFEGMKMEVTFRKDRSVQMGSRILTINNDPLDLQLDKILGTKEHNVFYNLVFPQAYAFAGGGIGEGFVAVGILIAVAATAAGAVLSYIPSQIYQAVKYGNGTVVCSGDYFVLRSRSGGWRSNERIIVKEKDAQAAAAEYQVDPAAARAMMNNPDIKCTDATAAELTRRIRTGAGTPVAAPPAGGTGTR